MAVFSLSPSVEIKETDLTLIVPAVATAAAGFVGNFRWGPVDEITLIDSEKTLLSVFGELDDNTATDFLTAASYLAYSNNLRVVRVVGNTATNAYNGGSTAPVIKNLADYETKVGGLTNVRFIAKYPGTLGNSIKVSIADSASFPAWDYRNLFGTTITVNKTGSTTASSPVVTFSAPHNTSDLSVGMFVTGVGIPAGTRIQSIDSPTQITLTNDATATNASVALTFTLYTGIPGTSSYAASKGGSNDELHVVIVDELGLWTGTAGTVLEKYSNLSKASDAKNQGTSIYYVDVLNRMSKYVWFGGTHLESNWGSAANGTNFASLSSPANLVLAGGVSSNPTVGDRVSGYNLFARPEAVDISFLIASGLEQEDEHEILANYVINIANTRRDCIAFVSPPQRAVVNNPGKELQAILNFRNRLNSSSYAVLDSGWKLTYNRYKDKMHWIPLCADLAGLCAYTDDVADPWFSPAGLNRGFVKNIVKLAYNPDKTDRDALYTNSVNPVINHIGEGVVLFGDKTLQGKPSAFDRINVRRLFIVLEKAIATAAKYQMFELNDEFTRSRFVGMVEPYLRDIQGRRGVIEYKVVCDTTNNTPEVIDSNSFVADIYIKPARSINFVQLNFVATPTGISFEEVA